MDKQEVQQLINILNNWKDYRDNEKKILDVFKRLIEFKFPDMQMVKSTTQARIVFHKGICKADDIPEEWFQLSKKLEKTLRKSEQQLKKKKQHKPAEFVKRKSQVIDFPKQLFEGKSIEYHPIYRVMYKSFVNNFEDKQLLPKVVQFIHSVYDSVEEQLSAKFFMPLQRQKQIRSRVDKICQNLDRPSSAVAKVQMIKGIKTPKQVAENLDQVYVSEKVKQLQIEAMRQFNKANDTGYYEEMRKKIHKDASQQCRFCHKSAAYCYDQKQIRASDEPMTRFMTCNNCNKNWRD